MGPKAAVKTGEAERLRRKLDLVLPELVGVSRKVMTHPRLADFYPEYLFTCHCIARASVPLMEAARDRALSMPDGDPVSPALASYLEKHIVEEKDHDEWFLEDLEVLGWDRSTVLTRPPSSTVAALVGAQYYWVLHYHPVALLGFLTSLESHPPARSLIDEMIARTAYDPRAFRTLIEHADLDPHHEKELYQLLDDLPLTPDQSAVLGLSAMHTLHMVSLTLVEIIDGLS